MSTPWTEGCLTAANLLEVLFCISEEPGQHPREGSDVYSAVTT
jgi:hypothetical protein